MLYPLILFIPILAGLGLARAGVETWQIQSEVQASAFAALVRVDFIRWETLDLVRDRSLQIFVGLVVMALLVRWLRDFRF